MSPIVNSYSSVKKQLAHYVELLLSGNERRAAVGATKVLRDSLRIPSPLLLTRCRGGLNGESRRSIGISQAADGVKTNLWSWVVCRQIPFSCAVVKRTRVENWRGLVCCLRPRGRQIITANGAACCRGGLRTRC